jgi:TolC family type I secretion outer membrane protein
VGPRAGRFPAALVFSLGLAVLATGCATVRRAREAQSPDHVPPGERTVTAAELGLTTQSVLTLDRALALALTNHPSVTQARQNLLAAGADVRQARSAYWPSLDADAGYRTSTANTEANRNAGDVNEAYSGALSLDVLLYDFGKTPAQIRQSYARELTAAEDLRAALSDLIYAVRTAYLDLLRAQELLRVREEAAGQFQLRLDQVRAFVEVGRRIRYDVTKAEVDLGNAHLALIDAQNTLATARATLNRRLGLAESPDYPVADAELRPVTSDFGALLALARERHPGIRALKARQTLASAAVDEAIADLYPALRLQADASLAGGAFPLVRNAAAALRATVGLFSGWRRTARIDQAAAQLRSARAAVADREQQVGLDLNLALSLLNTAQQRLTLTGLVLRQARENVELAAEQYRLGKASAVEVTDAQVTFFSARADDVKARFDCQTAIAQIRHATGEDAF